MKHNLIALAVATALITPMAAHAAPKVYGKLNVSVENISDNLKEDDRWEAISNASRFGVKGEDEVTANVSAVYGIEWGVTTTGDDVSGLTATTTVDTNADGKVNATDGKATSTVSGGNKLDLTQRNRYIGLKHQAAGTIKFGKVDSYLKTAQGEVDQFNDLNADLDKVIAGDNRINNVVAYESPKIANLFQFNLQIQPGEEVQDKTATGANCLDTNDNPNKCDDNGLFDAISASVVLNSEEHGLYAALAIDQNIPSTFNAVASFAGVVGGYNSIAGGSAATDKTDTIRLVGSYNLSAVGLTLGALAQTAERSEAANVDYTPVGGTKQTIKGVTAEEKSFLVSAAYKLPVVEGLTLKAQYATATTSFAEGIKDVDLNQASLGVDYNLASKTKVYAYYSVRTIENGNNPKALANGKTDSYDVSFFGLGVDHKF